MKISTQVEIKCSVVVFHDVVFDVIMNERQIKQVVVDRFSDCATVGCQGLDGAGLGGVPLEHVGTRVR